MQVPELVPRQLLEWICREREIFSRWSFHYLAHDLCIQKRQKKHNHVFDFSPPHSKNKLLSNLKQGKIWLNLENWQRKFQAPSLLFSLQSQLLECQNFYNNSRFFNQNTTLFTSKDPSKIPQLAKNFFSFFFFFWLKWHKSWVPVLSDKTSHLNLHTESSNLYHCPFLQNSTNPISIFKKHSHNTH